MKAYWDRFKKRCHELGYEYRVRGEFAFHNKDGGQIRLVCGSSRGIEVTISSPKGYKQTTETWE
jgi:hypothetical protein